MRRLLAVALSAVIVSIALLGCRKETPAYMHPYGEGVDPASVTTETFHSRVTTTTVKTTTTTGVDESTSTTQHVEEKPLVIPEGHVLCPMCLGVRVICEKCLGNKQIKVEVFNEVSGTYVRQYVDCTDCPEDPGYKMCEVCRNQLYIPE